MDNFNLKKYLAEGTIHQDISENKKYKQGYDDREDESLGARKGAEKDKKQDFAARRGESYGKFGKRDAEAKGKAKGPGKNKVNKEGVEEAAPGYTHDCAAHVMHESHGYGLCLEGRHTLVETTDGNAEVTHYDVMFKSGNIVEKIPVNELKVLTSEAHTHPKYEEDDKDAMKEEEVEESALGVAAGVASLFGGAAAYGKIMKKLEDGDFGEKGEKIADMLKSLGSAAATPAQSRGFEESLEEESVEEYGSKPMYDEDDKDAMKEETGRMKVSELKAKIREDILSVLSEQEEDVDVDVDVDDEVEADVDVDVQDTVSVDAEGDDIEIEKKAVKAKVQVGLSPEEEIVQDSLKAAMDAANALGNEKLADQIGNTITFFTREYVVGGNTD